jgi:parvulin-like peptidyl-prolyl isomerase
MAELIPKEALEAAMTAQLAAMNEKSLPALLVELQLLPQIIRNIASQLIVNQVAFEQQEIDMVNKQISQGLPIPPEDLLSNPIDTINQSPENLKPIMTGRYREMQLRKLILDTYQDVIDPYFLERRTALEKVVYAVIRVSSLGVADELYLRLIDGEESFEEIAQRYSEGDERYTKGLVGPLPMLQVHPAIQKALLVLAVEEVHPPIQVEKWYLILSLVHIQPARMNDETRMLLMRELYEKDLELIIKNCVESLIQSA